MSAVRDVMIRRFLTVFGEPKTDNPSAIIAEYEKALNGHSVEVLNKAVDKLFRRSKFRVWPTIGECVDAIGEALADGRTVSGKSREPSGPSYPEWSDEAFAVADRMVKCKLGEAARDQDWLLGLHEFIRRHRRYPNGNEQKEIIAQTRLIDRCAAGAGDMGVMHQGLKQLAASMVGRRADLTERLFGAMK